MKILGLMGCLLLGACANLGAVAGLVATDLNGVSGATLAYSQPAKGQWGQDGVACTYLSSSGQFTVFEPAYCHYEYLR
jgi:hypothetical protein